MCRRETGVRGNILSLLELFRLFHKRVRLNANIGEKNDSVSENFTLQASMPNIIFENLQGFASSRKTKKPQRSDGSPIPWYTYPAIEYLDQIDFSGLKIFEYGCGQSSLYFADRGALVWSVDHDEDWYIDVKSRILKNNKSLLLRKEKASYAGSITESGERFDIIIIDGIWRNECIEVALPYLQTNGIILLDNSDWYTDVSDTLKQKGFFQIDFNGFGPCNDYCWTTSLLFKKLPVISGHLSHPKPIGGIIPESKGDKW